MNDMTSSAIAVALAAGAEILKIYAIDFSLVAKADDSPLTEADECSHNIICRNLSRTGLPLLSEEGKSVAYAKRSQWNRFWLIDPLDGTKEFIKKNGEFTVNIALVENGKPVLGVVLAPVLGKIYWGVKMDGQNEAWVCQDCMGSSVAEILERSQPISAASNQKLRVVASRSHGNMATDDFISELENDFGTVERVSSGSSLKLCLVADGTAAIYPRIAPTMEWDTAAAQAVVEAAGGHVVEYDPAIKAHEYLDRTTFAASNKLKPLSYNKENLLNPYFVAAGCRND